ncbi:MAG: prolipoprotein diacylglyceryl transferase, partial [Candidatus Gastranaerophilales bacterium]|nr:prolipoprotein diacylglyceryl transferase [Candidatus Gastranaerophilales bacterium]
RWGNFFNSEAFGRPTENFLKLYIPIYKRPIQYLQCNYFHPTFLYESILDICIFLILFFVIRKLAKNKDGIVFFSYLILYSIVRIIVEQLRIDSVLNIYGIPVAQIVSLFIILISIVSIFIIRLKK